jgi:hypothetical protein
MECHIRALRISYLSSIANYRSKGRSTAYMDEIISTALSAVVLE